MDPSSRARVFEELKDLRRRGELRQIGDVKAALGKLSASAQKVLKKNGVFSDGNVIIVKITDLPVKIDKTSTRGITMFKTSPARKGTHPGPVKTSGRRQKVFRVLEIEALADRVFGDAKKAQIWLRRPNASMSGQVPLDLLKDELGAAVVREALEQIDHGIFA